MLKDLRMLMISIVMGIAVFFAIVRGWESGIFWSSFPWPGPGAVVLRIVFFPVTFIYNTNPDINHHFVALITALVYGGLTNLLLKIKLTAIENE